MKVVNWNVQWATPASVRSPEILRHLAEHSPDIICLTETDARLLSEWDGHLISPRDRWGPSAGSNQQKVLLWSRCGWTDVDDVGCEALPKGRYIAGSTQTSVGPVTVIGVCIPYHNANVNVGTKNKEPWEDHSTYLSSLASILKRKASGRLIMMGDFNQQIRQQRRPYPPLSHPVRAQLQETIQAGRPPGLTIVTAGLGLRGRRTIDHIAISGELSAVSLATIDNMDGELRLSDHFGVVADLYTRNEPQKPLQKSELYDNQQSSP